MCVGGGVGVGTWVGVSVGVLYGPQGVSLVHS